jgi:hypothetical protein
LISASQIDNSGRILLGDRWLGVYSLDEIPYLNKTGGMVINTQPKNLPGEHWIAVYIKPDLIQVHDPLGIYYPNVLVNKIMSAHRKVVFNRVRVQDSKTVTCGHLCLIWLSNV